MVFIKYFQVSHVDFRAMKIHLIIQIKTQVKRMCLTRITQSGTTAYDSFTFGGKRSGPNRFESNAVRHYQCISTWIGKAR
jgi:hypothetical protein